MLITLNKILNKFKHKPYVKMDLADVSISLVDFKDDEKPVVYGGLVYQSCFIDFDGDLILKDDVHGVKIFHIGMDKENETYNLMLLSTLENHPINLLKQIEKEGNILEGKTLDLQKLVNEYYEKYGKFRTG